MSVSARKHKKDKRPKKVSSKVTSDEEHEPSWRPQRVDSAPSDMDPLRKAPHLTRSADADRRPSSAPGSGLLNVALLPPSSHPNPLSRSTSPPVLSPKGSRHTLEQPHEAVSVPVLPTSKRAQLAEQQTAQLLEVLKYASPQTRGSHIFDSLLGRCKTWAKRYGKARRGCLAWSSSCRLLSPDSASR
jgi:hypothetical protein